MMMLTKGEITKITGRCTQSLESTAARKFIKQQAKVIIKD